MRRIDKWSISVVMMMACACLSAFAQGDSPKVSNRKTFTLNQILDEWSREFYFEGRRRVDLIRFGYYGGDNDYSWQWKGGSKENGKFSADMNIFAIPETDLNANSNLKQNPGY